MSGARAVTKLVIFGGLAAYACTLTSSLDELEGQTVRDAGFDGGKDGSGGAGGIGGTGATGGQGGKDSPGGGTGGKDGSGSDGALDPCALSDQCPTCCVDTHQVGAQGQLNAIKACVCADTGFCSADCSAYCVGGTLDSQCSGCIGTAEVQTCLAEKCKLAPECETYTSCVADCNPDK